MPDLLSPPAIALGGLAVSLANVLRKLHQRGHLLPLLQEAALEDWLLQYARLQGCSVAAEELQQSANRFRRQRGLDSAEQTRHWLHQQRLTAQDLEAFLERDLLIAKLKDHLTRDRIADHFASHQDGYARARLRQIVVPREDLARELLSQIRDDGGDFSALAREHSQHASRAEGGQLGWCLRQQLTPAVAAAVFTAVDGALVGPLATAQGFQLLLVEERREATLDAATSAAIRQELFDAWLADQLRQLPIKVPLLGALGCTTT